MIEISLFGRFRATDSSGRELYLGRKSQCLMCLLALGDGLNATREKAAGLIWSDRTDDQARSSLRQELAKLRRVFGSEVLEANRQSIWLVPEFISIDVRKFRAAIREDTIKQLEAAAAQYSGPILDGHHSILPRLN